MSDSKQHSDLFQKVREAFELVYREHFEAADDALAALDSLEEQLEAAETEREQAYATAQAMNEAQFEASVKVTELREQLEAARTALEEIAACSPFVSPESRRSTAAAPHIARAALNPAMRQEGE